MPFCEAFLRTSLHLFLLVRVAHFHQPGPPPTRSGSDPHGNLRLSFSLHLRITTHGMAGRREVGRLLSTRSRPGADAMGLHQELRWVTLAGGSVVRSFL